ncbi:MAG: zinc ribbon domain-containing protein [Phycisphaerales bacterium]
MTVTAKLLKLFRVDQQLRGLKTRLNAAERFLAEQEKQQKAIEAAHSGLEVQTRKAKAATASDEKEAKAVGERMETIRKQMDTASNSKLYSAYLTELNTLKVQKDTVEKRAIEQMENVQKLEGEFADATKAKAERAAIVSKAREDRDTKSAEIKDRVDVLAKERAALAADVPKDVLKNFEALVEKRGDEAMASVEVLDRRNHEWTCGACMMTLPMETVNGLSMGRITRCSSCGCFLYTEEDVVSKKKQAAET